MVDVVVGQRKSPSIFTTGAVERLWHQCNSTKDTAVKQVEMVPRSELSPKDKAFRGVGKEKNLDASMKSCIFVSD